MGWVAPKSFCESFGTPLGRTKKILTTPPQIGRFGGCRNFYQLSLDHFWSKKIFWPIFWVGKESYLEWSHACWMVPLCQKCTIMRSKGPGTLYIEFRDHLSKFEKWPNSAHFDKLTVGSHTFIPSQYWFLTLHQKKLCFLEIRYQNAVFLGAFL